MKDKEQEGFQWITLFFVTGFSFLLFSLAVNILNGKYFSEFLITSIISLTLGSISFLVKKFISSENSKSERSKISS